MAAPIHVDNEFVYKLSVTENGDGTLLLGRCPVCRNPFQIDADTMRIWRGCDADAPHHPAIMLAVAARKAREDALKRGGIRRKKMELFDDH